LTADSILGTPTYVAANAKDADINTFWHSDTTYPHYLQVDMGTAQSFDTLVFTPRQPPGLVRVPLTWKVEVSSNGSTWTQIATGSWADTTTIKYANLGLQNYRYLKLTGLTGTDGYMACAELNLWNHAGTEFAPHNMTTNTAPPPWVASASSLAVGYRAFDGSFDYVAGAAVGNTGNTYTFSLDVGPANAALLNDYDFCCHQVINTRAPKAWTVEGSNNGSSWTVIDTVTAQTNWAPSAGNLYGGSYERRMFSCDTQTTQYRYFRWVITDNNGDATNTQVEEVFMYGVFGPARVAQPQPFVVT